jgi:hypothetical protein
MVSGKQIIPLFDTTRRHWQNHWADQNGFFNIAAALCERALTL